MERGTVRAYLADFVDNHRGLRLGSLFGRPGVFAGRRVFACLVDEGIIVKLPEEIARREIRQGAAPYERRGRVVRAWVMYQPRTSREARRLWPILELAARNAADFA